MYSRDSENKSVEDKTIDRYMTTYIIGRGLFPQEGDYVIRDCGGRGHAVAIRQDIDRSEESRYDYRWPPSTSTPYLPSAW